jgi:hypothetical protein
MDTEQSFSPPLSLELDERAEAQLSTWFSDVAVNNSDFFTTNGCSDFQTFTRYDYFACG